MKAPLKSWSTAAAIVPLMDSASSAINRLRRIHPPAHVIIVSPMHEIYYQLKGENRGPEIPPFKKDFTKVKLKWDFSHNLIL